MTLRKTSSLQARGLARNIADDDWNCRVLYAVRSTSYLDHCMGE